MWSLEKKFPVFLDFNGGEGGSPSRFLRFNWAAKQARGSAKMPAGAAYDRPYPP